MSRDLGRDVPDLEKLYARKLWADFSYPTFFGEQFISTSGGLRWGFVNGLKWVQKQVFGCKNSGRTKRETAKGETGPGTHIFTDFCRFSLIFGSLCKSRDLGVADLHRKPQETADFRRKPQKTADFCRNWFLPFAVSLLARS